MKVDIRLIKPNPVALRQVDKKSAKYQEIVASIPHVGILNPPNVIKKKDENGLEFYELVDGLHRYTAALECGMPELPVHVLENFDTTKVLTAQVIGNLCRVETKPIEFTKQLCRILDENPTMTHGELAEKTGFTATFIEGRLKLKNLADETLKTLVNEGSICLQNAYALAGLPAADQIALKDQAITEPSESFLAIVKQRRKAISEGRKTGGAIVEVFPGATPHCRPLKELQAALQDGKITSMTGADVIKWALHMDDESVAKAKAEWDARKAKRDEAAAKRAESQKERKVKQAEELKKKSEAAAAELAAMAQG